MLALGDSATTSSPMAPPAWGLSTCAVNSSQYRVGEPVRTSAFCEGRRAAARGHRRICERTSAGNSSAGPSRWRPSSSYSARLTWYAAAKRSITSSHSSGGWVLRSSTSRSRTESTRWWMLLANNQSNVK